MEVDVRFFAAAREAAARASERVTLPETAAVSDLARALASLHPPLAALRVRYAVNERFAAPDTPLRDGDVVALIPPVSGG